MRAADYFQNGYSCSESIVKAAVDLGLAHEVLLQASTVFSGGMGSGCLCGAVAGAQMVIGSIYGKEARPYAKKMIDEFRKANGATCCKVLTHGFDFHSVERKKHCYQMVTTATSILYQIIKDKIGNKIEIEM